jgi:hypothetical protein
MNFTDAYSPTSWQRDAITPDSMKGYMGTTGAQQGLGSSFGNVMSGAGMGAGIGSGIGSLLSGMFGSDDSDSGPDPQSYLKQIPSEILPYLKPYMNLGQMGMDALTGPEGKTIGAGYQQSPGLHFAIQQALQGAGHSAALGGMAGSPMAQQQSEQLAGNLGQQDYYKWLQSMTGLTGMGQQASRGMADDISQALAAQAEARYAQQAQQAQQQGAKGSGIGSLLGGLAGGLGGFFLGGPVGAANGASIGSGIGGSL